MIDIQSRMTDFAMLGATWVMWLLIALSVLSLAVAAERALALLRGRKKMAFAQEEAKRRLRRGDVDGARAILFATDAPEARIALAGIDTVIDGTEAAEERIASETVLARMEMEKRLAILGTIGNNAPFVGLLGTVIGIIRAFSELQSAGGQVSAGLMAEVGEALVATAIGLLVALPAVALFNVFQRVIKARLGNADALAREVLAALKSKKPEPAVARAA